MTPSSPSPVIIDQDIVWARKDGYLSRHDSHTGDVVWRVDLGDEVSTDLLALDGSVILGLQDQRLLRIDPTDGSIRGANVLDTVPTYRWIAVDTKLVVGMTGVGGPERQLLGVAPRTLEVIWSLASPGESEWTTSQPAFAWDHILVGTKDLLLYAVHPSTGEISWTADLEQPPRTIRVVADVLYIGSFDGSLTAYRR